MERAINGFMRSGRYASCSQVLRDGLWLLDHRERKLQKFDAALARSLADEEVGRVIPAEEVFAELRDRCQKMLSV